MRWVAAGKKSVERMQRRGDRDGLRRYAEQARLYAERGWASLLDVFGVAAEHGIALSGN